MQTLIRFSLGWVGLFAILMALAGCEAATQEKAAAPTPAPADQKLQQVQQFEQRMSTVLDQIANQDKALSDLRVLQDQTLKKAVEANKALMEEFVALRREMSQALGYETAQPAQPATPKLAVATPKTIAKPAKVQPAKAPAPAAAPETAPAKEHSRIGKAILRLVLVVILLAAIWLIIQIFMGRWTEEDDDEEEEEDEEEDDEEEEIQFPMGVAPSADEPKPEEPSGEEGDEPREEPTDEPDEEAGDDKPAT